METSLIVFYTGGLGGDLAVLPRLHTFIRQLRARASAAVPGARILLLDQGGACAPDVWHCAVTDGRSALVALDGMGVDAAHNDGYAPPDVQDRLGATVNIAVVTSGHPFIRDEVVVCVDDAPPAPLTIDLRPAGRSFLADGVLRLERVVRGQVGEVRLEAGRLVEAAVHHLPPGLPPDPTISGIVDFILAEARLAQKRREQKAQRGRP